MEELELVLVLEVLELDVPDVVELDVPEVLVLDVLELEVPDVVELDEPEVVLPPDRDSTGARSAVANASAPVTNMPITSADRTSATRWIRIAILCFMNSPPSYGLRVLPSFAVRSFGAHRRYGRLGPRDGCFTKP